MGKKEKEVQRNSRHAKTNSIFWLVMPRILEKSRNFGGTYGLHFQDRNISQARNERETGGKESKGTPDISEEHIRFHFHGRRIRREISQQEAGS
jgi:hypothetical protein